MGCAGSAGNPDARARLDVLAKELAAESGKTGDEGLPALAKHATELREMMKSVVDAGGKDLKCLHKLELRSDDILANLEVRITPELIRRADYESVKEKIFAIAKDLDACRATTATSAVEGYIAGAKAKIKSEEELKAKGHIPELKEAMDKLKEPSDVAQQSGEVLDLVEKTHAEAPDSKNVTDTLLRCVVSLASIVLRLKAKWLGQAETCTSVHGLAERLDNIARNLVGLMGATWDPPMVPQVENEVKTHVSKVAAHCLTSVEKELAANDIGAAFDSLDTLKPWWSHLKDDGAVSVQLVGIFSKVHTVASQEFAAATKASDAETAEAIREFARKFDVLRTSFDGLPPPTDLESKGLVAKLAADEAVLNFDKQIKVLKAEIAKTVSDDKSLATLVQAMEALVPIWPTVLEADASCSERLQATCTSIEAWAQKAATQGNPKKVDTLLKFAEAYDDRRTRLSPPAPKAGPLQQRIAEQAASAHLRTAEGELAKEKGMNPMALLSSLRATSGALKGGIGTAETRQRLSAAFQTTSDRVSKTFVEALVAGEARKPEALQQFAADFDEVWASFSTGEEEEGAGESKRLVARLEAERERYMDERMDIISKALPKTGAEGAADFAKVIGALASLQSAWAKATDAHADRLATALAPLSEHMDRAGEAARGESPAAVDKLLGQAGELDTLIGSMLPEHIEADCRPRVVAFAANVHMAALEAALGSSGGAGGGDKGGGDKGALARELSALQPLCADKACPQEVCKHFLDDVFPSLEAPLMARMAQTSGSGAEADTAVRTAGLADDLHTAALKRTGAKDSGSDGSSLRKRLEDAKAAAQGLGKMQQELAKPSGMNPNVVVQALGALQPHWAPVASAAGFHERLTEMLAAFEKKLLEAGGKAGGNDAKLKALLKLAQDADEKQRALLPDAEVKSFEGLMARMTAERLLTEVEAELDRESGMNSANVLKGLVATGPVWPLIGKAEVMAPEFDAITELHGRMKEVQLKVRARMQGSLRDALTSGNSKKKAALMKFATEFDTACEPLKVPGVEEGSLVASLQAESAGEKA